MICQRLTFAVVLGMVPAVAPLPAAASEKATITAPVTPPRKHTTSKSQVEGPSPFRSLKSGDSGGSPLDASSLPTVPSIDPKAARQLIDKLEKDRDWLLDDTGLDQVDTTKGLEDAWEIDDPKERKRNAIERKLLGKEKDPKAERSAAADREREELENRGRTPRRGSGDFDGETDLNRRSEALELRGSSAPGERELNPFQSANAGSNERADRAFGSQSGFIGGRSGTEFESPLKTAEADFNRRMERLGLTPAASFGPKESAMQPEAWGQERQMRVDQFTQALSGNTALSGLGSGALTGGSAASFSSPASSSGSAALFDKPMSDFSKSFLPAVQPTPAASRGFDFITTPRVGIQPLPKLGF